MKFHDELNQKLFNGEELKPEVKDKLNEIANAFIEYLEVPSDAVKDAVLTGSSVSYNYTPHSDIDLHLKVDYDKVHEDCPIVQGYLWSLKASFNKDHDISIYGVPVEVYAEPLDEDTVHNGLYSLWQDKWIDFPEKIAPTDNDDAVLAKYNEIKEAADRIEDSEVANELLSKIYEMRKAGLTEVGEFSTENLAFKKLRDAGVLDKLKKMKKEKIDKELSLESYNEGLKEPTGELAVFLKRPFNAYGKPDEDYHSITDFRLSQEDAEAYIKKDIGYDRFGYNYQIRDKQGNILKDIKWTDIYNKPEDYDAVIKHEFEYANWKTIAEVLRLANPNAPQEKIDKKIEELKQAYEQKQRIRTHAYFDGATWQNESIKEGFFKKELTPLPKKKSAYKIGDTVKVGDKEGKVIVVKSMGLSDTPVYKIKLDDGLVWKYEEELGVEMKEEFVQPYELYLYKRTEDGNDYDLVKDLHFDTEEEMRKHLATVKDQYDSFEMGKREADGSSLGKFTHIDEDVATLTDKVDTAQAELDSIIQSLKPSIKEELENLINEALK